MPMPAPRTVVSLPSIAAILVRTASGSGDSRASSSWLSSTAPAAPATYGAATLCSPIPPATQTGTEAARSRRWSSTNAPSSPIQPPASWPLAIRRVRAGGLSGLCLLEAGGDCVHAQAGCLGALHEDRELRLVGGRDEDALETAELRRRQRRQQFVIVDEHSPGPAAQLGERGQLRERGVAIDGQLEVEHAERARPAPRDRDRGVGRAGWRKGDEPEVAVGVGAVLGGHA